MASADKKTDWWEKQQQEFIRQQPGLADLRKILLAKGGKRVALREEMDLKALLGKRARDFPVLEGVVLEPGPTHDCHTNVAILHERHGRRVRWATGWMLFHDEIWRQHSWGWDGETVWETKEPGVMYWGIVLTKTEVAGRGGA